MSIVASKNGVNKISEGHSEKMERSLSENDLIFISLGAIAGSGIFMIPGIAAEIAGPASFLVWIIIGILAIMMSMCIAELAGSYPDVGGFYSYATLAFGRVVGFLTGWTTWVIGCITISMLLASCISNLGTLVQLSSAAQLYISLAILIFLTLVNFYSTSFGAKLQRFLSTITIFVFLLFIVWGIGSVDSEFFTVHKMPGVGLAHLLAAAAIIIEPFMGWETITFLGGEAKNPRRAVPNALVKSTIIIVVLYSLMVFVALGQENYRFLAEADVPLQWAAKSFMGPYAIIISIGAVIILLGTVNSWIMASSRIPYDLAHDNFLPDVFAKIHPKYKTPVNGLIIQTLIAGFLLLLGQFELLLHALIPLALINYTIIFLTVIVLRLKDHTRPRAFRVPGFPFVPLLCAGVSMLLIAQMSVVQIIEGLSLVMLGIPIFIFLELEMDQKALITFNELMAPFYDTISNYIYPKSIKNQFLRDAIIKKDDLVLDLACHTGFMIDDVSKRAKRVISTDIGFADIEIAREKISKDNVVFIRCEPEAVPFRDEIFHKIIGFGVSDEVIDSDKLFSEINRLLRPNGRATILLFENPLGFFATPYQWTIPHIEDRLEELGLSFRVRHIDSAHLDAYEFIILKSEKQTCERIANTGFYLSYYFHHISRALM